jgi:hypothetical protein
VAGDARILRSGPRLLRCIIYMAAMHSCWLFRMVRGPILMPREETGFHSRRFPMTTQQTAQTATVPNPFPVLARWIGRVAATIAAASTVMACAREAERLMALSDTELAELGLTRERIVDHAFARYMAM